MIYGPNQLQDPNYKVMTVKLKLLFLAIFLLLTSCNRDKQLTGRYYLKNDEFGKALCYRVNTNGDCVELISNNHFSALGWDDNYIIVQVYPDSYLIVPVYKKFTYFPKKGILGPMNAKEFNELKEKLKINAHFTIKR